MTAREQFIAWLNDARSTELAQIPVLQNHADDAKDYPEIRERDLQHLEETRRQAEQLETMIVELGGSVSMMKTAIGKIAGFGHSISTEIFPDELIKNFLADYAAEHFEIASYISLIATAELIGEEQCIPVLEEILAEEVRMAQWLEQFIPFATDESLKTVAGEDYRLHPDNRGSRQSRRRSSGTNGSTKQSLTKRIAKPSTLLGLLGIGAIGAGAAYLLGSDSGKRTVQNFVERSKQRRLQRGSNGATDNRNFDDTTTATALPEEVTIVETVVISVDDAGDAATQVRRDSTTLDS